MREAAPRYPQIWETLSHKAYGVSRSTVYKLATEGRLPLRKIGGRSLIRIEDAEALLTGGEAK